MITDRQSFFAKFQEVLPQLHVPDLSFNVSNNSLIEHNDYPTLNSNAVQSDQNDFSFVKKFGKLAFKYSLALNISRKKVKEFIVQFMRLIGSEKPSPAVSEYCCDVFYNENRLQNYLDVNFCKFSYYTDTIGSCKIFKTDLTQMFKQFLSVSFLREFLFFGTERKQFMDNIFDGNKVSPAPNTLFLSIYFDDFNPLLNSLSSNSTSYKCSSIYFKVLNMSPLLLSKRSCVLPFSIF